MNASMACTLKNLLLSIQCLLFPTQPSQIQKGSEAINTYLKSVHCVGNHFQPLINGVIALSPAMLSGDRSCTNRKSLPTPTFFG
jgi:hypothetical protein